jgi:hypothetical protein
MKLCAFILTASAGFATLLVAAPPEPFRLATWVQPVPRHAVLVETGYHVWCGSVIEDQGRYHMFYSRWPVSPWAFGDGWLFASEICHAVADQPTGPFTPTGVVLGRRPGDTALAFWDSQTQHNPHIRKFGNTFYLYYMASVDPGPSVWPGITQRNRIQRNQRIGVVSAKSIQDLIDGNFTRPGSPIVSPVYSTSAATDRTTNPTDFAANRIVNNPSVTQRPDGTWQLLYKSNWPQAPSYGHGYALANDPAGPFTLVAGPVFSDEGREDEHHWHDAARGKYHLLVKNFNRGGTEQMESPDGVQWTSMGVQWGRVIPWADGVVESVEALERPQILLGANGEPVALYLAARRALAGGAKQAFSVHIPLAPPTIPAAKMESPADVLTSGLLVQAINFGADAPVTLNGLTFTPAGTDPAILADAHGFTQAGGASGAALQTGAIDAAYEGIPEFEGFLDTMAWQSQTAQTGATLGFELRDLAPGREYRLQLFFAESRAGALSRHGPVTVSIAGQSTTFDFGPTSYLVVPAATAVRLTATFTATANRHPITLTQLQSAGGGLQLSAFALHEISLPASGTSGFSPGGFPAVSWNVVPGFTYRVQVSPDLLDWQPAPGGEFTPSGQEIVRLDYLDPSPLARQRFYRLARIE